MPVEIRELVIRMVVPGPAVQGAEEREAAPAVHAPDERGAAADDAAAARGRGEANQEIVQEAVRQVMRIIEARRER